MGPRVGGSPTLTLIPAHRARGRGASHTAVLPWTHDAESTLVISWEKQKVGVVTQTKPSNLEPEEISKEEEQVRAENRHFLHFRGVTQGKGAMRAARTCCLEPDRRPSSSSVAANE